MRHVMNSVVDAIGHTPLVRLSRCFPQPHLEVLAKLEMLNPSGSMKDRPARAVPVARVRLGSGVM